MIKTLLAICNARFQAQRHGKSCSECTYADFCPSEYCGCERCLELIHFPDRVADGAPARKYDCTHMADYYVCKYACKYVSELVYAFDYLRDLKACQRINVLSFGCGPCTDLLALEYLRQKGVYSYDTLEYRGIDYGKEVWGNIHNDIRKAYPSGTRIQFIYEDVRKVINSIYACRWVPDLVVFQYFFSDMNKNADASEISSFVNNFADYVNSKMPMNSYVVMNDINLSTAYGGGREYFDKLLILMNNGLYDKGHFRNNSRPNTYNYGREFEKNTLFFDTSAFGFYNPFGSCSSAQMIYKKGSEAT